MKRHILFIFAIVALSCSGPGGPLDTEDTGGVSSDDAGSDGSSNESPHDAGRDGQTTAPDAADTGPGDVGTEDATSSADLGPIGGDRPVDVVLPQDYDGSDSYPVVVLLHGYTATAAVQNAYFRTSTLVDEYQFLLVLPEGTSDNGDNQFWNATNACCDFYNTGVDDSSYLRGVVDEVLERYAADPERVYFMGHSNGGYMSYRMACDHDDRVAAIASLAGSSWLNADDCEATEPVGVLQIHGTNDPTVQYDGMANAYPGAEDVTARWATHNGCATGPTFTGSVDYDSNVNGEETDIEEWSDCDQESSVELWKMNGSGHIPGVDAEFTRAVLDFLFAHRL